MKAVLALALAGFTFGGGEHWIATSTSAISITGDVTVRPDRIVFANGGSLPVRRVRTVAFTDDLGLIERATVYRVPNPADPVLLHRNRICGEKTAVPIRYVVMWNSKPNSRRAGEGRALAAYSGRTEPPANTGRACAVFRYEIEKGHAPAGS
jgi:hypothetical protein